MTYKISSDVVKSDLNSKIDAILREYIADYGEVATVLGYENLIKRLSDIVDDLAIWYQYNHEKVGVDKIGAYFKRISGDDACNFQLYRVGTHSLAERFMSSKAAQLLVSAATLRILEKQGPMLALLFAHDFGGNINLPIMYGLNMDTLGDKEVIDRYYSFGGSPDAISYVNFGREDLITYPVKIPDLYDAFGWMQEVDEEQNTINQHLSSLASELQEEQQLKRARKDFYMW